MTEPTEPQATPTAPISPAPPSPPAEGPTPTSGPSKKLLIAAIVFGLIGVSGVSFTAGYWTSELGGHHKGHSMHHRGHDGKGPQARPGAADHQREGARPARMKPSGSPSPSAAPSTTAAAPTP